MFDLVAGHQETGSIVRCLESVLGFPLSEAFAQPAGLIYTNAVAQPLICAAELAHWQALKSLLPEARAFAGYSVGELAAYGCAGALSPEDTIRVAQRRAVSMNEACAEACRMIGVRGLQRPTIDALAARHEVHVAIINERDAFVVGGRSADISGFEDSVRTRGGHLTALPVHVASHTPLMRTAAREMQSLLHRTKISEPRVPVLAGIDGMPVRNRERIIATLSAQLATPIDWAACVRGLQEAGCTTLLELGPGTDLTRAIRHNHPEMRTRSVSEFRSLAGVITWVQGALTS